MLECARDDGEDAADAAVELDERTGVENRSAHRPNALSAAFRARAVSGPPVSASISSSNDDSSSSFAFSSIALAT